MNLWAAVPTREQRIPDMLAQAKAVASRRLRDPYGYGRFWWESRDQYRRYRASPDPVAEYPDETEHFVQSCYDDLFGSSRFCYFTDIGRIPNDSWMPTRWQDFLNMIGLR